MAICSGGALDSDGWPCKFIFKIVLVEQIEEFVQVSGCSVVGS